MHADSLPITGPCPIDLDAIGFDRTSKVSHCQHCSKNVTILSNMTRGEAQEFLRRNRGQRRCVSYARDEQGRIRFRDDPATAPNVVPATRLRRREAAPSPRPPAARGVRAAGMAVAFGLSAAMAACTPHESPTAGEVLVATPVKAPVTPPPTPPEVPLAGDVAIPDALIEDGEVEVPDPEDARPDAPCDRRSTRHPERPVKPKMVEPKMVEPTMVEGEIAVPEVVDPPEPPEPRQRMVAGAAVMPAVVPAVDGLAPSAGEDRSVPASSRRMQPL